MDQKKETVPPLTGAEREELRARAVLCNLEPFDLSGEVMDPEYANLLSRAIATDAHAVAIGPGTTAGSILVATTRPADAAARMIIEQALGRPIEFVLAHSRQVREAIARLCR